MREKINMSKNKTTILFFMTIIVIAAIGVVSGHPDAMEKNMTWNVIAGGQTKERLSDKC